ncbi:MAG TPA: hypothetical protein VK988_17345 [Acidimicrobiales bacterium]|nr:hypothetical protein [Acidimicrobiales bacterium]
MRGAVVLVAALAAAGVVGFLVTRSGDEAPPQAVVRIEAPDEVCWDAQLSIPEGQGASPDAPVVQDGCGHDTFDLGTGRAASVVVTKTTGPGLLSAAILVDGEEVARQTTTLASDSITVAPPRN